MLIEVIRPHRDAAGRKWVPGLYRPDNQTAAALIRAGVAVLHPPVPLHRVPKEPPA